METNIFFHLRFNGHQIEAIHLKLLCKDSSRNRESANILLQKPVKLKTRELKVWMVIGLRNSV